MPKKFFDWDLVLYFHHAPDSAELPPLLGNRIVLPRPPRQVAGACMTLSIVLAAAVGGPVAAQPQRANVVQEADPNNVSDRAVLTANGDEVNGRAIRNSCGDRVQPQIGRPRPDVAIVLETDPTGKCSGNGLPGSLTVLLLKDRTWRVSTSTIGNGFNLGELVNGYPDIVVQYPPSQRNCPVLGWNGKGYEMALSCSGVRASNTATASDTEDCKSLAGEYAVEEKGPLPYLRVLPGCEGDVQENGTWKRELKVGRLMSPRSLQTWLHPAQPPNGASGIEWGGNVTALIKVTPGWSAQGFKTRTGLMLMSIFGPSEVTKIN